MSKFRMEKTLDFAGRHFIRYFIDSSQLVFVGQFLLFQTVQLEGEREREGEERQVSKCD